MILLEKYVDKKTLIFLGSVRGLEAEREEVLNILESHNNINAILLSISPEELDGLNAYLEKPFDMDLSDYEVLYGLKLKTFGKVKVPVPSYLAALNYAKLHDIKVYSIDMDEGSFAEEFSDKIGTFELIRHSWRKKKVWKKKYDLSTPENFAVSWDREMTRLNGYKLLEQSREKHFAARIKELIKDENINKVFVVIDVERLDGTVSYLTLKH